MQLVFDHRRAHGSLWNAAELAQRFDMRMGPGTDLDAFVYEGYRGHGAAFLAATDGRFAIVHHDPMRRVIFLARDWIGETPLHWIATPRGFHVASTISELKARAGADYCYGYVRAFPQSKWLEIDVGSIDERCVSETCRYRANAPFYDFAADCEAARRLGGRSIRPHLEVIREALERSVQARAANARQGDLGLLLSGGLDSLSVGLVLRSLDVPFTAYTLSVESGGEDVVLARSFAQRLGVEHKVVEVSKNDVIAAASEVVGIAETYHLYNFFCSIGMYLLGRRLADDGVMTAFCGEAVNEAIGDYHDWTVADQKTGEVRVLQHVNYERMKHPSERLLYVWGNANDRGKYNRQLGTGLAKHAAARMIKPFLAFDRTLECPYYDRDALSHLIALPADRIEHLGGKAGVFLQTFGADLERLDFPRDLVEGCKKVRFQDASEGGRGGLTPVLLEAGFDQERLLRDYNEHRFSRAPNRHLVITRAGSLEAELEGCAVETGDHHRQLPPGR